MKVGDLKKLLEGVPDDTEVLISGGPDHSYRQTDVGRRVNGLATVAKSTTRRGRVHFAEWYDETNASPGEEPVEAFVIVPD